MIASGCLLIVELHHRFYYMSCMREVGGGRWEEDKEGPRDRRGEGLNLSDK